MFSAPLSRVDAAVDEGKGRPGTIRRSSGTTTVVVEGFLQPRHIEIRLRGDCQKRYRANLDTQLDKL